MQMHFKQMFGHKQRNSKPIRVEFGCRKTRNSFSHMPVLGIYCQYVCVRVYTCWLVSATKTHVLTPAAMLLDQLAGLLDPINLNWQFKTLWLWRQRQRRRRGTACFSNIYECPHLRPSSTNNLASLCLNQEGGGGYNSYWNELKELL